MTAFLLAISATVAAFADDGVPRLIERGGDPARGCLVNVGAGGRPIDPALPTLVFVHGLNVAPGLVHLPMAERLGEAVARRGGRPRNVLGWNWNGATLVGLFPRVNHEAAVAQGLRLAGALLALGIDPGLTHLIGQSSGSMVIASAAEALHESTGVRVGQLTLLDPAVAYHHVVFGEHDVTRSAERVENAFAPGPSGFGRGVWRPGVENVRVEAPRGWSGVVNPRYSAHLNVVRWYLGTVADPSRPGGFNGSAFDDR